MEQRLANPGEKPPRWPPIVLAVLWAGTFLAFKPTPFDGIDFVRFYQPYQHFLSESVWKGELPWWNPYSSLGRPFLADLQAAALYPATLLVILFGPHLGWLLGTFAHGWVAAEGFARLTRKFGATAGISAAAGAAFLFGGPVISRMQEGEFNVVYALCYMPWVLWLAAEVADRPTRRLWVGLTSVFALELWCGHPQIFWLSAIGAGLFATGCVGAPPWGEAWRRWVRAAFCLFTSAVTAMALLGFALVPFMELVGQSNRATPSASFSGAFSMVGLQWMAIVWPTWSAFGVNWEYDLFCGAIIAVGGIAALVACRGPALRGAAVMAICAAVIAAGPATPLFSALYSLLPGMSSFRVPARAGILITLALILGSALLAGRSRASARVRLAILVPAAAALLAALLFAVGPYSQAFPVLWFSAQASFACLAGLGWWLWTGRTEGEAGAAARIRRLVLPAALAGELLLSVHGIKDKYRFQTRFPGEAVVLEAAKAGGADQNEAPARICVDSTIFRENAGMDWHVASVVGYESLSLGRVWNYLHLASGADPSHAYSTVPDGRIFNAAPGLRAFNLAVSLPLGGGQMKVYQDPDPRAYLVNRTTPVADSHAATLAMVSGADFHESAVVEAAYAGELRPDPAFPAGTAVVTRFTLNSVEVLVTSPGNSVLVLAEAWYPGWTAQGPKGPLACVPVNGWMRGVPIPAGKSLVHLEFRQDGLALGSLITAVAATLVFLVARGWPRRLWERGSAP
jgi:hypothetical protein